MATSNWVLPSAGIKEMRTNGLGLATHLRLFAGTLEPTMTDATLADWSASEIVHGDYAPQDMVTTCNVSVNVSPYVGANTDWNGGANTTISAKYVGMYKGDVAGSSSASKLIAWCDGETSAASHLEGCSVTNTNPAVATKTAHGFVNADKVCITVCEEKTFVGFIGTVANTTANTFEITELDASTLGAAFTADILNLENTDEAAAASAPFQMAIGTILE